jgi:hypothetical protein
MQPGGTTEYNPQPNPGLYWDYDSKYNRKQQLVDNDYKIGGTVYLPFVICPPDHRVDFKQNTKKQMDQYHIQYEISPIIKYNEMEGRGIIKLTVTKEIPKSVSGDLGLLLELDLKKPLEDTIIDWTLYSSNPSSPNNGIYLSSQLPLHQTAAVPVFQRVYGVYSNPDALKYKYYGGSNQDWINQTTLTRTDSPDSTTFDFGSSQWQKNPTGVLPEFNNATYVNSTSEYLKKTGGYTLDKNGNHRVEYSLEIGDGEEHYILLDKTHAGMFYEINEDETRNSIDIFNKGFAGREFYKDKQGRAPTAELKNLDNGDIAIRITGGKDFMVYDRVNIINRKKFTFTLFDARGSAYDRYYYFAFPNASFAVRTMTFGTTNSWNQWGGYIRQNIKASDTNGNSLGKEFAFYEDPGYDDIQEGYLYNYNSGKKYYIKLDADDNYYLMFMNKDSKFNKLHNFRNINMRDFREPDMPDIFFGPQEQHYIETTYSRLWHLNYRAIIEAINHNIGSISDQAIRNLRQHTSSISFMTAIEALSTTQKETIYKLLNNRNGSMMPNYYAVYEETKREIIGIDDNGATIENIVVGNEYATDTFYIKRETEYNSNLIYDLSDFDVSNRITGFPLPPTSPRSSPDRKILTEDITGTDGYGNVNYAPVVTRRTNEFRPSDNTSRLEITYRNSYGNSNKIYITVIHRIRSDNCIKASGVTAKWDDVNLVNQIYGMSSFSTLYGYFFVDNKY